MIAEPTKPAMRSARSQVSRHLRYVAGCVFLAAATLSHAQQGRDYYHANDNHADAQTLRNAEQFHIQPGIDRIKERNYPSALQDFEFILDIFPNHPGALALMSDLCDVQWRSPRCDPDSRFQAAIDRNPAAAQTYVIYGLHLQRRNQLPQAVEVYKKAISLNSNSANAHYNLALAYFDLKQFDLANQEAQISYALGIPLPGLKDKLMRAKVWKPLDADQLSRLMQPPAATPTAAATPAPAAPAAAAPTTPAAAAPTTPAAAAPAPSAKAPAPTK
jgi:tetratricopeptide (TPR) repeat protein